MCPGSVKNNIPCSKPIVIDGNVRFGLVVRSSDGRVVRKTGVASVLDGKVLERRKLAAWTKKKATNLPLG